MQNWYEVDDIWARFGIKDLEAYVQQYVVKGHFHADVPADIVKAYKTAEYLMAHAFYHWPLYDEALKKLLGILEMAVKLRCGQLAIAVEFTDKGKLKKKDLSALIDQVCAHEKAKNLQAALHHSRKIRNHYAHPETLSFMGGIARMHIMPLVNIINLLFQNNNIANEANQRLTSLQNQFSNLQKGIFVLSWQNKNALVTSAEPRLVFKRSTGWYAVWVLPVLQPNLPENIDKPFILTLPYPPASSTTLSGTELATSQTYRLDPAPEPLNLLLAQSESAWQQMPLIDQGDYNFLLNSETIKELTRLQYQYNWN